MVEAFHDFAPARPIRKKFAKPPVKVACLPWYAPPDAVVDAPPLILLLVVPRGLVAEGRNPAPMYVSVPVSFRLLGSRPRAMHSNWSGLVCLQGPQMFILTQQTRWPSEEEAEGLAVARGLAGRRPVCRGARV